MTRIDARRVCMEIVKDEVGLAVDQIKCEPKVANRPMFNRARAKRSLYGKAQDCGTSPHLVSTVAPDFDPIYAVTRTLNNAKYQPLIFLDRISSPDVISTGSPRNCSWHRGADTDSTSTSRTNHIKLQQWCTRYCSGVASVMLRE